MIGIGIKGLTSVKGENTDLKSQNTVTEWICRMVNSQFPMVKILILDISSPKTQSVDLFCFSILIFTWTGNCKFCKKKN